jgi:hypothetical protein
MAHSDELREFVLTDRGFNILDTVGAPARRWVTPDPFGGKHAVIMQYHGPSGWIDELPVSVVTLHPATSARRCNEPAANTAGRTYVLRL